VTDVTITDTMPDGTTYVPGSVTGKGADVRGLPRIVWRVGTVKRGATVIVSFRSRIKPDLPPGTRIRNTAKVDGFEVDPYTSEATGNGVEGVGTALARTSGGGYGSLWLAGGVGLLGFILIGLWAGERRRAPRTRGGAS
jgi:hypothetical protein